MFKQANWGNPLNIFSVSDLRGHCLIAREFIDNSGASFMATWVILREDTAGGRKGEEMILWLAGTLKSVSRKTSGGQSTQIKYLSKSTDTYTKILLQ